MLANQVNNKPVKNNLPSKQSCEIVVS